MRTPPHRSPVKTLSCPGTLATKAPTFCPWIVNVINGTTAMAFSPFPLDVAAPLCFQKKFSIVPAFLYHQPWQQKAREESIWPLRLFYWELGSASYEDLHSETRKKVLMLGSLKSQMTNIGMLSLQETMAETVQSPCSLAKCSEAKFEWATQIPDPTALNLLSSHDPPPKSGVMICCSATNPAHSWGSYKLMFQSLVFCFAPKSRPQPPTLIPGSWVSYFSLLLPCPNYWARVRRAGYSWVTASWLPNLGKG